MPELYTFDAFLTYAKGKEDAAKERGHLTEEDWSRLRVGLAKQDNGPNGISRESYFDVLDGLLTVDEAVAIGYEEPGEFGVQWTEPIVEKARKKENRMRSNIRNNRRVPKPCECGCEGMTGGGNFIAGHDMKLKGYINRGEINEGNATDFQRGFAKKHGKVLQSA